MVIKRRLGMLAEYCREVLDAIATVHPRLASIARAVSVVRGVEDFIRALYRAGYIT